MMWPPQRVKIVSTPSLLSALATKWPPEMTPASRLFFCSVSSAVVDSRPWIFTDAFDIAFPIAPLVDRRGSLRAILAPAAARFRPVRRRSVHAPSVRYALAAFALTAPASAAALLAV